MVVDGIIYINSGVMVSINSSVYVYKWWKMVVVVVVNTNSEVNSGLNSGV